MDMDLVVNVALTQQWSDRHLDIWCGEGAGDHSPPLGLGREQGSGDHNAQERSCKNAEEVVVH